MKYVLSCLGDFLRRLKIATALATLLLTALLIYLNYHYGLEQSLLKLEPGPRMLAWFGLFACAYALAFFFGSPALFRKPRFVLLLLAACGIFALKLALPFPLPVGAGEYWQRVLYYPFKLLLTVVLIAFCQRMSGDQWPLYGTEKSRNSLRPYLYMLLIMVPLLALAALQPDFQAIYPKWMHIESVRTASLEKRLLYELSYGSDFVTIELFFRGFLVLAFLRFAGQKALLPMAVFYCTIHFGKPLGECISSFFGGLLLGLLTYHTRSIRGGLMVHLGIAWLMEAAGWAGHIFF